VRYTQADLEVLTATANAVAVKLRNITLEEEIHAAAKIQKALIPSNVFVPDGYEVDAHQMMCRSVGGDLYFVGARPNGRVLIALGDVTGKGMPAALAMSATTVSLGILADIDSDMETLAGRLHRQLFKSLAEEQFVTLFVGELDPATGAVRYVNAGHEPVLLVRANGAIDTLDSTTLPLAMIEEIPLIAAEARLDPGDLMVIFSDGIPEATTSGDNFLGLDRVKATLTEKRNQQLPAVRGSVVSLVEAFLAGGPASDDVTLVMLRRHP